MRKDLEQMREVLELERYMPYMSPAELREYGQAITSGEKPLFSPATLLSWEMRANRHANEINAKFTKATAKSDELCRQRTVRK